MEMNVAVRRTGLKMALNEKEELLSAVSSWLSDSFWIKSIAAIKQDIGIAIGRM